MTPSEARAAAASVDFRLAGLPEIFAAFKMSQRKADYNLMVYYREPDAGRCGLYPVRLDEGDRLLHPDERSVILGLLDCITFHETWEASSK